CAREVWVQWVQLISYGLDIW
nr:immunoglobulin heavy chain junction region [Macaca mulatta]MPN69892.1 immunoglobulin heavy chain junction region [Macaca mulatta]MPN69925.1 immunoglobulin heavy chain junction region [Macaca mulatta]MPN70101.1 immunoglobulin heavy chain junction region [Macaca mulatta]MPN70373.1 immunoglobulin heavy chain junction region [Macaca mulatta]